MMSKVILILVSYLIGSIPTGLILSRAFAKVDVRNYGSRNIGATNVYRSAGKKLGILTLLGDIIKGFLPVYFVYLITGSENWTALSAVVAFLGHLYPIYLKFSGGKGVATGFGVFLFLAPKLIIFCLGVFAVVLIFSRYVSLSSMSAALTLPLLMIFLPNSYPPIYKATALFLAIMIIFRHQENIKRIINRQESKIGAKKVKAV